MATRQESPAAGGAQSRTLTLRDLLFANVLLPCWFVLAMMAIVVAALSSLRAFQCASHLHQSIPAASSNISSLSPASLKMPVTEMKDQPYQCPQPSSNTGSLGEGNNATEGVFNKSQAGTSQPEQTPKRTSEPGPAHDGDARRTALGDVSQSDASGYNASSSKQCDFSCSSQQVQESALDFYEQHFSDLCSARLIMSVAAPKSVNQACNILFTWSCRMNTGWGTSVIEDLRQIRFRKMYYACGFVPEAMGPPVEK